MPRIDHDRLFKELLSEFFVDFLALFLPEVHAAMDPASVVLLDKEIFTGAHDNRRLLADLAVRLRYRGRRSFFVVHIEAQAHRKPAFAPRMFRYFAGLSGKYGLPVYPLAVLSYPAPRAPEPDRYQVAFPGLEVLDFRFRTIQLGQLAWRDFRRRANPVAAALMARMRMQPHERPRVKVACLRLLASLPLTPPRRQLITGFIDSYLHLDAAEEKLFRTYLRQPPAREEDKAMQVGSQWIVTSWERRGMAKGHAKGMAEGRADMAVTILEQRLGAAPAPVAAGIRRLSLARLDKLARALLDFRTWKDAAAWLSPKASTTRQRVTVVRRASQSTKPAKSPKNKRR